MKKLLFLFLLLTPLHHIFATPPAIDCFRYGYSYIYELADHTLPETIEVSSKDADYLLINKANTPLTFESESHITELMATYEAHMIYDNYGNNEQPVRETTNQELISNLVYLYSGIEIKSYASDMPPQAIPESQHFEIRGLYGEQSVRLTGTVSYKLKENVCDAYPFSLSSQNTRKEKLIIYISVGIILVILSLLILKIKKK